MNKLMISAMVSIIICMSCEKRFGNDTRKITDVEGYIPIYGDSILTKKIWYSKDTVTENAGKIYAYGNYIFQNDVLKGIHVINNSNKLNPIKEGFINVGGCTELSIRNNFLYTNNFNDLIVIDLVNFKEVARINNAFPENKILTELPPFRNVYFECVDYSRGRVIGWKKEILKEPKCYKN